MSNNSPGGWDTFNARWLTSPQIAKCFIPPSQYWDLAKNTNTILIGPRGSGKTTLLKMLQPSALEAWDAETADYFRNNISFTGVFIPADISWRKQLDAIGEAKLDSKSKELFSQCAFTTHIAKEIIESIIYRSSSSDLTKVSFQRCALPRSIEAEFVTLASQNMSLSPELPTLRSLKQSITNRMNNIYVIAQKEAYLSESDRDSRLANLDFLFLDPIQMAITLIELFDTCINETQAQWALLFDELEITTDSVQQRLLDSLRSRSQKIRYKLALSPFNQNATLMSGIQAAQIGNDFDSVQLWYPHKEQGAAINSRLDFSNKLWSSVMDAQGDSELSPERVLGNSIAFDGNTNDKLIVERYKKDGPIGRLFVSLYKFDSSFKTFMDSKGIDPANLLDVSSSLRDSVVRKVTPLVIIREFFLKNAKDGSQDTQARTRKSYFIYTGYQQFFDLSEGHPRWLKLMTSHFFSQLSKQKKKKLSPSIQCREIDNASKRFEALLRTYPSSILEHGRDTTLFELITIIGDYFKNQILGTRFSIDPHLSFVVDSATSDTVVQSLQQALNLGAIIYVPENNGQLLLSSLRNKRFRLSHWLAPVFRLPTTLGKPVNLSKILNSAPESIVTQTALFEPEELQ